MTDAGKAGAAKLRRGQILFSKPCVFLRPVKTFADLPKFRRPEVAFCGRSNVGKSSIINALTNRHRLARVSNTPGRTREINLFDLGEKLTIADLPGYGFAKVSKAIAAEWHRLIEAYLQGRPQLRRVILLIDSRHGATPNDVEMMKLLDASAASFVIVLTKIDKLKVSELTAAINDARQVATQHIAAFPEVFATSSDNGKGIPELRAHLADLTETSYKA